jgi:hypothetical protein
VEQAAGSDSGAMEVEFCRQLSAWRRLKPARLPLNSTRRDWAIRNLNFRYGDTGISSNLKDDGSCFTKLLIGLPSSQRTRFSLARRRSRNRHLNEFWSANKKCP